MNDASAARRFLDAWNRAESTRGCYSCGPTHDCRCPYDRGIGSCACGRDELEAAALELEKELEVQS